MYIILCKCIFLHRAPDSVTSRIIGKLYICHGWLQTIFAAHIVRLSLMEFKKCFEVLSFSFKNSKYTIYIFECTQYLCGVYTCVGFSINTYINKESFTAKQTVFMCEKLECGKRLVECIRKRSCIYNFHDHTKFMVSYF